MFRGSFVRALHHSVDNLSLYCQYSMLNTIFSADLYLSLSLDLYISLIVSLFLSVPSLSLPSLTICLSSNHSLLSFPASVSSYLSLCLSDQWAVGPMSRLNIDMAPTRSVPSNKELLLETYSLHHNNAPNNQQS